MAKAPKKRANAKGAAKKAAPAKKAHKKVKKPARSCLQAVVEQEAKKREPKLVRFDAAQVDAIQRRIDAAVPRPHPFERAIHVETRDYGWVLEMVLSVWEHFGTEQRRWGTSIDFNDPATAELVKQVGQVAATDQLVEASIARFTRIVEQGEQHGFGARVSTQQPKRYRFRDAITGLFVRAAAALKRPFTTVRERVR